MTGGERGGKGLGQWVRGGAALLSVFRGHVFQDFVPAFRVARAERLTAAGACRIWRGLS